MVQEFPLFRAARENFEAAGKMQDIMDLIGEIRSLRAEMNIDPKRALNAVLALGPEADKDLISGNMQKIQSLARLHSVEFSDPAAGNLLRGVWKLGEFGLDVHDAIHVASERERMQKEIGKIQEEIDRISKKLNSPDFLSRAPEPIVLENRTRHSELLDRVRKLEVNLQRLPAK